MTRCVSFVTTLYNKAVFLPFVLAGLKAQTGPFEREFVFVDDGSTDNTVALLKELTEDWTDPVTIVEQENQGPSMASNNGFAVATGDLIKPVDGDDMLNPWCTAALLEAMEQFGTEIAHGLVSPETFDPTGKEPAEAFLERQVDPGGAPILYKNALVRSLQRSRTNPTSWLATADLVKRSGGCDPDIFIQDYSIELRLMHLAGKAAFTSRNIFVPPKEAPERLSGNEAQILHDLNMALASFLDENPLPLTQKFLAYRRALRRCWAWARRQKGQKTPFSKVHRAYLRVYFPFGISPDHIRKESTVFQQGARLRIPGAR
ncbi:glycosyltransferase family 2 protein [Aestuariispira insulae]|uniref:Glycosyl transferase family 2 n=1 Tax=Aestuariispira insulae TaxID=1461337 RepID=A0A3D9HMU5_9PROT|nr:glycosyltransferase [Aestuariispira insulae]RED50813.1 glycosyl transferase family 2 [Aestuariispira insulae]